MDPVFFYVILFQFQYRVRMWFKFQIQIGPYNGWFSETDESALFFSFDFLIQDQIGALRKTFEKPKFYLCGFIGE